MASQQTFFSSAGKGSPEEIKTKTQFEINLISTSEQISKISW